MVMVAPSTSTTQDSVLSIRLPFLVYLKQSKAHISTTGTLSSQHASASAAVTVNEIGSRSTVMLVAVMLVVMAVVFGRLWRVPIASAPFLAAFAAAAIYGWTAGALDGECTRESNYFCIRIGDKELEDGRMV